MFSFLSAQTPKPTSITRFFNWWGEGLTCLVPAFVRHFFQVDVLQLSLDLAKGTAFVIDQSRGTVNSQYDYAKDATELPANLQEALKELGDTKTETVLLLGQKDVLFTDVELPAEAESNLGNILAYEMDRRTPFTVDQVYHDYHVTRSENKPGHISVKMVIVPRPYIDHLIQQVNNWGLVLSAIMVSQNNSTSGLQFNLLPDKSRTAHSPVMARLNQGLIATFILIVASTVFFSLSRQETKIDQLKQKINTVSQEVREVQQLKKRIDRLVADSQTVIEKKHQSFNIVDMLNDLTLLIPDHTWLSNIQIRGERITIQGESFNTAELIGLIEASGRYSNAAFASPVVRDAKSGRDRFRITATLLRLDKSK